MIKKYDQFDDNIDFFLKYIEKNILVGKRA